MGDACPVAGPKSLKRWQKFSSLSETQVGDICILVDQSHPFSFSLALLSFR